MAVIEARSYAFTYPGEEQAAIRDVTFRIGGGEIILIAGDSGSGKSTLLRSLNGLIPEIAEGRTEGGRFLDGKDMDGLSICEISRKVGSVFQNPRSQFFTLNSTSEMVFSMENYGFAREEMERRLREIERDIPIAPLMGREIFSLSSGERQLLALASAMSLGPDILLFDEPSANLDYRNAMRLRRLLAKLRSLGKTVLVADHRFFYLDRMADRVFLIGQRTLRCFASEAAFRESSYNTRSFDLFGADFPVRPRAETGECAASMKNVSKWQVLKSVSMELRRGEAAVLVGANGAGKTTLARLLTGALRPDRGTVEVPRLPFYVMQDADYQLFGTSVESELEIGRGKLPGGEKERVLREMNLWQYRDTHPFSLSGGEKQRLQIAAAALSGAELIIFDEPTSGLDVSSMERVSGEIVRLSESRAVLVISHDYEFIRRTADRIIYLKNGRTEQDFCLTEETVERLNHIFTDMEETDMEETDES
ncbi:ABC transporter ATP-binding protein [Lachnoclostridium sp. Marseille-P6806]|uniref:ABC transporter ATP-binding protein n=1 Tax=Lachnoclostridium sp. Marseille-P6806 TaxID=2364793 RepID=UPI0013EF3FCF|nr:ABC transporter ATP-binding protein [Lachnoclostridium sp. Marseille-P6806]